MERFRSWALTVWATIKVVLTAWPTWAAGITAVVTGLSTQVVPELPGPWGVKAAAVLAGVAAVVRVVSHTVAVVTPVLFTENKGVLAPPPVQSPNPDLRAASNVRTSSAGGVPLEPG